MKIAICKPYFKHLTEKFPCDFKHLIHKWSCGIILIDHEEPSGNSSFENHKDFILLKITLLNEQK